MRQLSGATVPISLLDFEVGQPFGLFVAHVDALDIRSGRALLAEAKEGFDVAAAAFEGRLDGPVTAIRHPARDAARLGAPSHRVAKEDALDASVDDDALSADRP